MIRLFLILILSVNINAQIPLVNNKTSITSDLQNQIINKVNEVDSGVNSGNHWGLLGSGYKANYNIASFGTSDNQSNGANYIHIKINIRPNDKSEMYYFNLKGFAYGPSKPIDLIYTGYAYNGGIQNLGYVNPTVYFGMTQYESSDGYLVLRLHSSNSYFLSFVINTAQVGNGDLNTKDYILTIIKNTGTSL